MTNLTSNVESSIILALEELGKRLGCVDEPKRDIIGMYIVGYSIDEIANEHHVSTEFVENSIRSFLNNLG